MLLFFSFLSESVGVDTGITETELHDMYCLPEKRCKKTSTSSDPASKNLHDNGESNATLNTEDGDMYTNVSLEMEDNNTDDTTSHEPPLLTSPPKQLKSKNPFAKSQATNKTEILGPGSGRFSALNKFSKIKKTVVDQNTVIHSRLVVYCLIKFVVLAFINTVSQHISGMVSVGATYFSILSLLCTLFQHRTFLLTS